MTTNLATVQFVYENGRRRGFGILVGEYAVTFAHVVMGVTDGARIYLTSPSEEQAIEEARVVRRDEATGLALVRLQEQISDRASASLYVPLLGFDGAQSFIQDTPDQDQVTVVGDGVVQQRDKHTWQFSLFDPEASFAYRRDKGLFSRLREHASALFQSVSLDYTGIAVLDREEQRIIGMLRDDDQTFGETGICQVVSAVQIAAAFPEIALEFGAGFLEKYEETLGKKIDDYEAPADDGGAGPVSSIISSIDAIPFAEKHKRGAILGQARSGKTTSLYRMGLDLLEQRRLDSLALMPVILDLGDWADEPTPFLSFAAAPFEDNLEKVYSLILHGRVILLLDNWDQLSEPQIDIFQQFMTQNDQVRFVIACRHSRYTKPDLEVEEIHLRPLNLWQIQQYIHNYLGRLWGAGEADTFLWQQIGWEAKKLYMDLRRMHSRLSEAEYDLFFWGGESIFYGGMGSPDWEIYFHGRMWEPPDWEKYRSDKRHPISLMADPHILSYMAKLYGQGRNDESVQRLLHNKALLVEAILLELFSVEGLLTKNETFTVEGKALWEALTQYALDKSTVATYMKAAEGGQPKKLRKATGKDESMTVSQTDRALETRILRSSRGSVSFVHSCFRAYFLARALQACLLENGGSYQISGTTISVVQPYKIDLAEVFAQKRWDKTSQLEDEFILLAGLYADDCTPVVDLLLSIQPELAAQCMMASGIYCPDQTKHRFCDEWIPRVDDLERYPRVSDREIIGRALGCVMFSDGQLSDKRPGVGVIRVNNMILPDILWGETVPKALYPDVGGPHPNIYEPTPIRDIDVTCSYQLAVYPVTYHQFQLFIDAADVFDPQWWRDVPHLERQQQFSRPVHPYGNYPRVQVSWYQAAAFCRWLSHHLEMEIFLPSLDEWELAVRYPGGRFFPDGNVHDGKKYPLSGQSASEPAAVGIYPNGGQPNLGLLDVSGYYWEWGADIDGGNDDYRFTMGGSLAFYGEEKQPQSKVYQKTRTALKLASTGFRLMRKRPE